MTNPTEYLYGPEFVEFIRTKVKEHPNITELSFDCRIERQVLMRFRNGGSMADENFAKLCRHYNWALIARQIPPVTPTA